MSRGNNNESSDLSSQRASPYLIQNKYSRYPTILPADFV